jgi:hypothetical protein
MVEWRDAASPQTGWMTPEAAVENATPAVITSAGKVLKVDPEYMVLAQNVSEEQVDNLIAIPAGWIVRARLA